MCIMTNTSAITIIYQHLQPTNYHLQAVQIPGAIKKSLSLNLQNCQENRPSAEKWCNSKSQRTRQQNKRGDRKGELWNQLTAVRFQTGARCQTSPGLLLGLILPSTVHTKTRRALTSLRKNDLKNNWKMVLQPATSRSLIMAAELTAKHVSRPATN